MSFDSGSKLRRFDGACPSRHRNPPFLVESLLVRYIGYHTILQKRVLVGSREAKQSLHVLFLTQPRAPWTVNFDRCDSSQVPPHVETCDSHTNADEAMEEMQGTSLLEAYQCFALGPFSLHIGHVNMICRTGAHTPINSIQLHWYMYQVWESRCPY